jgi:hypothetical protein
MKLIKNQTPYLGKIKLKFEKYPEYQGSSILNKVHINLGFTKLVSRMWPTNLKDKGWVVDPEKVDLINKWTGGKIGSHTFHDGEYTLENSFLSLDDQYIGDIREGWRYVKNNLRVSPKEPRGVAQLIKPETYFTDSPEVEGYYGYTHRGGSSFRLGDRLFDSKYTPKQEDYPKELWSKWSNEYAYMLDNVDVLEYKWIVDEGIRYVIPFRMRGAKVIETLEEAAIAAKNMSNDLS